MSQHSTIIDDSYDERLSILQDLYAGNSSPQKAADALASISLSTSSDLEGPLRLTWESIIVAARETPEHQDKLVDVLATLARLPDAKDEQGEPLIVFDMRVWSELPILSWKLNYEWNGFSVPIQPGPERDRVIARFVHINQFVARLMATNLTILSFHFFALITMRCALETPPTRVSPDESLDAFVPAAAAWISILGPQIYHWDMEFEHGPRVGAPGSGGPLWENGKHGFCKERWELWRKGFGAIAEMGGDLSENVRASARQAEKTMREIEMASA